MRKHLNSLFREEGVRAAMAVNRELTPAQKNLLASFDALSRDNQYRVLGFIQALQM